MEYKCIKSFSVPSYNNNGFVDENNYLVIEEGTIWTLEQSGVSIIGGELHLDNVETMEWIEISKDDLEKHFE